MFSLFRTISRGRIAGAVLLILPLAALAAEAAARSSWVIDPQRTRIAFAIDAIGYPRTEGIFHQFEGKIAVDFDHPSQSRVNFRVETQSVDVGSASFSNYVRSEVLLNAAHFPEMTFASTSVEKLNERNVRVTGDLTLLGVTKPLNVDVEVERRPGGTNARLGFVARAKIDRLEFGLNSGYPIISREVDLLVTSEAFEQ